MKTDEIPSPILFHDLEGLAELCRAGGAVVSTVINSTGKVVLFYRDPRTKEAHQADFVDELHIRHAKNARLLIAVFRD